MGKQLLNIRAVRATALWLAAALIACMVYYTCLRFFYPGYFAPVSAFHLDIYEYTSAAVKGFLPLLLRYPRPVSYLAFKLLAGDGVPDLIAGTTALTLLNILLTLALAIRMLRLRLPWALPAFVPYVLLLFAHPQFYIEYRHDLPADVSLFFLNSSLLAWLAASASPGKRRWLAIIFALVFALLFAFAKETYFVSAAVIVLAFVFIEPAHRVRHLFYLLFLGAAELASFQWTNHFKGPFVNLAADPKATYHINLAPGSVADTFQFYLANLLNPWLIAAAALGLLCALGDWRRFIAGLALLTAGLASFAPLAVLPNHRFEEYAWAAAPFFLAPVLCAARPNSAWLRALALGVASALALLAVVGPQGYSSLYSTDQANWWIVEDHRGHDLVRSFSRFDSLPSPARVLVIGLDDATLPWQHEGFLRFQFGDKLLWTVALPPSIQYRNSNALATFVDASKARLADYDYVALYRASGRLQSLEPARTATPAEVPREPRESSLRPAFPPRLFDRPELTANPSHIAASGGSGLGITDLQWKLPPGLEGEIHIDAPSGPLLARGRDSGHARTEKWVKDGMLFFLQDVTGGKPLTLENTVAIARVQVE